MWYENSVLDNLITNVFWGSALFYKRVLPINQDFEIKISSNLLKEKNKYSYCRGHWVVYMFYFWQYWNEFLLSIRSLESDTYFQESQISTVNFLNIYSYRSSSNLNGSKFYDFSTVFIGFFCYLVYTSFLDIGIL